MKHWNKNINIPNALSVLRILIIIPFVYFFMNMRILEAMACLVISGLSDMFDGMIAGVLISLQNWEKCWIRWRIN